MTKIKSKQKYNSTIIVCMKCRDRFRAEFSGHTAVCKCGLSSVNESIAYMKLEGYAVTLRDYDHLTQFGD